MKNHCTDMKRFQQLTSYCFNPFGKRTCVVSPCHGRCLCKCRAFLRIDTRSDSKSCTTIIKDSNEEFEMTIYYVIKNHETMLPGRFLCSDLGYPLLTNFQQVCISRVSKMHSRFYLVEDECLLNRMDDKRDGLPAMSLDYYYANLLLTWLLIWQSLVELTFGLLKLRKIASRIPQSLHFDSIPWGIERFTSFAILRVRGFAILSTNKCTCANSTSNQIIVRPTLVSYNHITSLLV